MLVQTKDLRAGLSGCSHSTSFFFDVATNTRAAEFSGKECWTVAAWNRQFANKNRAEEQQTQSTGFKLP